MYQFRLPNVTELVVILLCISVAKHMMTFLGRLQVTNAHFNLQRKASSHQFSVADYIKNTGEALLKNRNSAAAPKSSRKAFSYF